MKYRWEILERTVCYEGFFRLERYRLRHELSGGGWGEEVVREVLERGHAAGVLLYDPEQDSVVLVEQFRIGALASKIPKAQTRFFLALQSHSSGP